MSIFPFATLINIRKINLNTYRNLVAYLENNYSNREIESCDMEYFKRQINNSSAQAIILDILGNDDLLRKIADRSYTHALGFDKIVLIDLSKDTPLKTKVQLRLHVWNNKDAGVPMVESMHEHSFNFISYILAGSLENQVFSSSDLSEKEFESLSVYRNKLLSLSTEDKIFINDQIEILEALKLSSKGSSQFDDLNLKNDLDTEKASRLLGIDTEDLPFLTKFQAHYVSNRVSGERKDYKHVFNKYLAIVPHAVLRLSQGDYYFHGYEYPHRLHYDNKILNATILLTTPVLSNPQGGSLQRPSYVEQDDIDYQKMPISKNELKEKLINLLKLIS